MVFMSVVSDGMIEIYQSKNRDKVEEIKAMRLDDFDQVYQVLNERFINEIIDSESDQMSGISKSAMNFLMLGETEKIERHGNQ